MRPNSPPHGLDGRPMVRRSWQRAGRTGILPAWRAPLRLACSATLLLALTRALTYTHSAQAAETPTTRSAMDAPLLYQLLIGEMELGAGRNELAFEVLLDAAKRARDEALFRRATQVAVQLRSLDKAAQAVRAWRQALPQSVDALRFQMQLSLAGQRWDDASQAFQALVERTPVERRPMTVSALPSLVEQVNDRAVVLRAFEPALQNIARDPALTPAAFTALGRLWASAGDVNKALSMAESAANANPQSSEPMPLALELMPRAAAAETLVTRYLQQPNADATVRLGYGQALAQLQRHNEALVVLEQSTRERPDTAAAWLTLGAVHLELRNSKEAEAALQRYLSVAEQPAVPSAGAVDDASSRALRSAASQAGRQQAFLMLAQAAEIRGDMAAASAWLERVGNGRSLDVVARRASLLARQGKLDEARALVRNAPETNPDDVRRKLVTEGQILREHKRWQEAYDLLAGAVRRFPQDMDLVYEQAMMAEKLNRLDDMERLLREVMSARPDNQHAYNALGYSLADRGIRLDEARQLVQKALSLAPGDPFITDSLGWVEFRAGNLDEALRLLSQAWKSRPDTEIGAHLGEVLWVKGRKDEARRIWSESLKRDAQNEVLKETLARLRVGL